MLHIRHKQYQLPFRHPFTISKGTKTHQPIFIVEIEWRGVCGYGEAPAILYYGISVDKMAADLEAKKPLIERYALTDPERCWHFLHHLFPENSFLICALDMAIWDLWGKLKGVPLYKLYGLDPSHIPPTDLTIGIDSMEQMVRKVEEMPWPIYKIKAGLGNDIENVQAIQSVTDAKIRVDVNGGWNLDSAKRMISRFKELEIELIEQPLSIQSLQEMESLYKYSEIPLIADESCVKEIDVENCNRGFHGVNIKLTKCGGITPARRMIKRAKELGMKVMLGCMCESTLGTAAIAHLAASVDFLDADGPLLLSRDLAEGLSYHQGRIIPSNMPGLGVDLIDPM
ncbi:MAG: dipeptide epimerase [Bacteroidetes bacterium]|nr:dipeptide epimerase [Bacteroidota bacterium]